MAAQASMAHSACLCLRRNTDSMLNEMRHTRTDCIAKQQDERFVDLYCEGY
jgi:hypothetical protein